MHIRVNQAISLSISLTTYTKRNRRRSTVEQGDTTLDRRTLKQHQPEYSSTTKRFNMGTYPTQFSTISSTQFTGQANQDIVIFSLVKPDGDPRFVGELPRDPGQMWTVQYTKLPSTSLEIGISGTADIKPETSTSSGLLIGCGFETRKVLLFGKFSKLLKSRVIC